MPVSSFATRFRMISSAFFKYPCARSNSPRSSRISAYFTHAIERWYSSLLPSAQFNRAREPETSSCNAFTWASSRSPRKNSIFSVVFRVSNLAGEEYFFSNFSACEYSEFLRNSAAFRQSDSADNKSKTAKSSVINSNLNPISLHTHAELYSILSIFYYPHFLPFVKV